MKRQILATVSASTNDKEDTEKQNKVLSTLIGKVVKAIHISADKEEFYILFEDGQLLKIYHEVCCCECFALEDVVGDVNRLIGQALTMSEGVGGEYKDVGKHEEEIWHYYKFATVRESISLRFMGNDNYYSDAMDIELTQMVLEDNETLDDFNFKTYYQ